MNYQAHDLDGLLGTAYVDLTKPLGKGATATVYAARLEGKKYAAKIYKQDHQCPTAKIQAMLANPPANIWTEVEGVKYPQLAWPIAILTDNSGSHSVGYLMPMVDLSNAFSLDHYYDQVLFRKLKSPNEAALTFKLEIAKNLSALVADLHHYGHYFIDMKPQNIRVLKSVHVVTLLDCDGFSVRGSNGMTYPAELVSTDYIAPEAIRKNSSPQSLGEPQDRYALAVILFQLLNRGTHPFQGILSGAGTQAATNDEKAAQGLYPHGLTDNFRIRARPQSIHHLLDQGLRALFDAAFIGPPDSRPTARDWDFKLESVNTPSHLVKCDAFPKDVNHIRFRDLQCPACYLAGLKTSSPAPTKKFVPREASAPASRQSYGGSAPIPPVPVNQNSRSWWDNLLGFEKTVLIGLGVLLLFVFVISPLNDSLSRSSSKNTSEKLSETKQPSSCTLNIPIEGTPALCSAYWGVQGPGICDTLILEELNKRNVFTDASNCGKPKMSASNVNDQRSNAFQDLANLYPGRSDFFFDAPDIDREALGRARKDLIEKLKNIRPILNQTDATLFYPGIKIQPFKEIHMYYSKDKCATSDEVVTPCISQNGGLMCDAGGANDDRQLCLRGFVR